MTIERPAWSFRFGPFVVDTRRRLLWRGVVLVPLTAKAFEILLVLLRHPDRLVL
jgi:DNA-binding winged helix-turn-helix (wHTH) protein